VKAGARKPDIGSADAFKRSMLAAKSIAYSRAGASGVYVADLMERLGIADQVKDKVKLVDGVPVAELVAKGDVEIGMQQINVILPVAGIDYVGPLPAELQGYVVFGAGILAVSKAPEAARAMAQFMAAPEAAPRTRKSGVDRANRGGGGAHAPTGPADAIGLGFTLKARHQAIAQLKEISAISCGSSRAPHAPGRKPMAQDTELRRHKRGG